MNDWQLIEDAPSEQTLAIVFCADAPEWQAEMWIGLVGGEDPCYHRITHWMRAPGPPGPAK